MGGIFGMNQPTITCPHCEAEITLTESLADPLIRATRKKIAEKEAEVARRESAIGVKRAELAKAVESIEQQFTTRLETERERIAAEEAEKARRWWATDLERKSQEVADLQRELQGRDNKLAEAQKAQTELIRKQQELVDAKREELELIYQYLSGPRFRRRIEAIVEKFSSMQTDLERERKAMTRLRAKREEQIRGVIESTVGMYGDLQGITGTSLEDIDGLVQIARRVEARRKRGLTPRRVTEPIAARGHHGRGAHGMPPFRGSGPPGLALLVSLHPRRV